jgi:signal transduction histidine kinase/ABC-type branched-subunit amino acid transport system ATPase component
MPDQAGENRELLRLTHVSLDYGQIVALKDVSLSLFPSKVHAVVGEHGAGKSSLGMVISGNMRPNRGCIELGSGRYDTLSTRLAHRMGIEMVHQQVQLNNYFSVAENIFFLDGKMRHWGMLSRKDLIRQAEKFLSSHDFNLDPSVAVSALNLPDRVLTSILGALQKKPRLLILDEALEKLSSGDLARVLRMVDEMKREGMAVLFITHRIDDVYEIADRVSIVKNGEILVTDDVGHIDRMNLLKMTYTQVYSRSDSGNLKREFNQFLKFNEAVLLNLPVNLIVSDAQEKVKIVNTRCKEYFRLADVHYADKPLAELLGARNSGTLGLIRDALLSDEGRAFYHVPLVIDGVDTVNNIRTLPIYDEGALIGNIIIIEDVTEFDKLQKQVILSEKLASLGLLAAGVAHEINNPLEIVYNYLKHIKFSYDDKKLHEEVDELHEEIAYIAGIVKNLLSLSNTDKMEREEIDLNDLIRNILSLLRHNADYKHIAITFDSPEKTLMATVNRNEMKQVVLNLVKNSFEAMPTGGNISVETRRVLDEQSRGVVLVTFTDSGPGIQDANLNDIFIPFYSTRKGKGDNIGLGLSICYQIVQRHGGSMSVRNLEGSGCRFEIRLPEMAADAEEAP